MNNKIEVIAVAIVISYLSFLGSYFKASEIARNSPDPSAAVAAEIEAQE